MHKVTIVDIANHLGLSPSTVSRALNGIGRMNEKTRAQVLALAREWGYHPNPHAQRLKSEKTNTIGVIVPELTHHFYSRIIKGVDTILEQHSYQQIICVSNEEYERERKAANTLLNARVDGLLVALSNETNDFDHLQRVIDEEVPIVFLDRMCEDIDAPYVLTDDFEGCRIATEYLINKGHRKIGFLKGPENISTTFRRFIGYKEALKKNNLPFDEQLVIKNNQQEDLESVLRELMKHHRIDALMAHSDYHAFRAMEKLQFLGYKIPEDISIFGYADEPLANYTSPKLTTVKQPAFEIGKVGMEMLLHQIENGEKLNAQVLSTRLIIRQSTH